MGGWREWKGQARSQNLIGERKLFKNCKEKRHSIFGDQDLSSERPGLGLKDPVAYFCGSVCRNETPKMQW
jgi:hypothetical protein